MAGQRRESLIEVDDSSFQASLEGAFAKLKFKSEDSLKAKVIEVTNRAKELCPVDTGRLRAAIGFDPEVRHDRKGAYIEVGVTSDRLDAPTNYAPFVEFGTSRQSPQPFLRPALAEASGGDFAMKSGGSSGE